MSNAITDFNYWLVNYSFILAGIPLYLTVLIYLIVSTPQTRRWTTPFTLAFLLLAISAIAALNVLLIYYYIHPLTANSDMLKRIKIVAGISQCLHGLLAQVSLAWMVYRIYPWKIFRFILPVVISLIGLGIGVQVWASILSIPGKDARTPGSVMGLQLMASLIFFTGLFIYRYRRKLKNSYKANRFYQTLLDISVKNALFPTLFVIPAAICNLFADKFPMIMVSVILTIAFRLILTLGIVNSLALINNSKKASRPKNEINTQFRASRLTNMKFISTFGLERRFDTILETFLVELHEMVGGSRGYFVEKNRFDQLNVICEIQFDKTMDGLDIINVRGIEDCHGRESIPVAALEHGLEQPEITIWDFDLDDIDDDTWNAFLSDQIKTLSSVLILPITTPDSGKKKMIYIENVRQSTVDLRIIELLAQHLASSLDSARLFEELQNTNQFLERRVIERTAELEQKSLLLEQAKAEALEAASAKSLFLSNMSHEIRTPISQVILASELLEDTNLSFQGKEYVNIITNSGRLLLNLVNDILDLSKFESGKMVLENEPFNLGELIQITIDAFTVDRDIRVGYYIQETTPAILMGAETRLRQILSNLVSNAIKFTTEGYVLLYVTSEKVNGEDLYDIQFKIIDTGSGIANDKIDRIFERFEQEDDSITRKFGGTGLGLAICQNLCTLMGSNITVESKLGSGSTFMFTIRFQAADNQTSISAFRHSIATEPRVIILEGDSCKYQGISVLYYQLATMGCATKFYSISDDDIDLTSCDVVMVDLSSCPSIGSDNNQNLPISPTILNSPIPVVFVHSTSQNRFLNQYLDCINRPHSHKLCHPYKQSSLFRLVRTLLNGRIDHLVDSGVDSTPRGELVPSVSMQTLLEHETDDSRSDISVEHPQINILLAEDNSLNQLIIANMTSKLGYSIDIADDGASAVNMAKTKHYHLILMDVRMPNMDGLEATRQIRSFYSDVDFICNGMRTQRPFIAGLSADVLSENQKEGLNAGMDLYLPKPVSKMTLQDLIERVQSIMCAL